MKTSKVISIIAAAAIGLLIAVLLLGSPEKEAAKQAQKTLIEQETLEETSPVKVIDNNSGNHLENENEKKVHFTPISSADSLKTDSAQTITPEKLIHMITLKTSMGDIELMLNAEKAPHTVENFINYAKNGQYDGTIFHRVIKGFMIQGGGFEPGMQQKKVGAPIPNEANNGLANNKYTVAMARTSDPHSATAQFFINATNNDFLNFTSESGSGWGYAVFGEVIKGQEIVDAIETVSTGNTGGFGDVPREDVIIESVIVSE